MPPKYPSDAHSVSCDREISGLGSARHKLRLLQNRVGIDSTPLRGWLSRREKDEHLPHAVAQTANEMDAPNVLGDYVFNLTYHPLEPDTVRLVRFQPWSTATDIHCSLSHQYGYFQEPVKYMALSYCWGQAQDKRPITINGRLFYVTANLRDALAALWKYDAGITFWVDAICINQQDVIERNAQVQQMWRIFGSAHTVDVWLGTGPGPHDDSSLVQAPHGPAEEERTQQLLRMLSTTQYFTRTWVIPEILQARTIFVMCGEECVPWSDFSLPIVKWLQPRGVGIDASVHQLRRLFEARRDVYGPAGQEEPHVQFIKVIYLYLIGNCWDPRDKIFALLGHPLIRRMGDLVNLRVDYRLTTDELALAVLAQYRRLDRHSSYPDTPESWSIYTYEMLMAWLEDMLQVRFASAAFGRLLRQQIVWQGNIFHDGQTCLIALLRNDEEILVVGQLLQHV